jgi:phytoene dehydrogenase-like protein
MTSQAVDAVVVGSGPNGLAAAITLARSGHSVMLLEAAGTTGGGVRSAELTLPGFVHDTCSAVYPFGRISPFFSTLGMEHAGLRWVEPRYAIGHPLDDRPAVLLERDVDATAVRLGRDADAYRRAIGPLVRDWDRVAPEFLAPFHVPLRPLTALRLARFGLGAIQSATSLARRFRDEPARALVAGAAAHSILPLTEPISAAAAFVMLGSAHVDGWPFPTGGSARLAESLADELVAAGGSIHTGREVRRWDDLPAHRVAVFDTAPRALAAIAGDRLPARFRRRLTGYRHAPGVFKLDLALDGPIPWRDAELAGAGTIHVGGTFEEIARAEALVARGRVPERPFVLLAQPSLFDPSRAPAGRHTVWAYCHVPNGSLEDAREPILRQVERFAPGFRDRILAVAARGPADLERHNPNNVGGDIAGGRQDLAQLFTRPSWRILDPYSTPDPSIFLCSASTPPGGGVHGMCGYHAARSALRRLR